MLQQPQLQLDAVAVAVKRCRRISSLSLRQASPACTLCVRSSDEPVIYQHEPLAAFSCVTLADPAPGVVWVTQMLVRLSICSVFQLHCFADVPLCSAILVLSEQRLERISISLKVPLFSTYTVLSIGVDCEKGLQIVGKGDARKVDLEY